MELDAWRRSLWSQSLGEKYGALAGTVFYNLLAPHKRSRILSKRSTVKPSFRFVRHIKLI